MNASIRPLPAPRAERGVSLIIAMLMLVVIGLASVAIIRNTSSADKAVLNNRLQTQANQFAQVALQFCENQLTLKTGDPGLTVNIQRAAATPQYWTVKSNWIGGNVVHTLDPKKEMTGSTPAKVPPQCMVEVASASSSNVYIVTARGFSDDYTQDSNNATVSGSVVWLQSTVYL